MAEAEAKQLEGVGAILNEHYTFQEYINRRADYLGNHSSFRSTAVCVFPIARSDAEEIFYLRCDVLSVQEVRRREVRQDIRPLLPLPTTANTYTIDNFNSYSALEWPQGTSRSSSSSSMPSEQEPDTASIDDDEADRPLTQDERSVARGLEYFHSNATWLSNPGKTAVNTSFFAQPANNTKTVNGTAQTEDADLSTMTSTWPSTRPSSSSGISNQLSTQASSPSSTPHAIKPSGPMDPGQQSTEDIQAIARHCVELLGNRPALTTYEPRAVGEQETATAVPGSPRFLSTPASALANRAIISSTKPPRGRKQAATTLSDRASVAAQSEAPRGLSEDSSPPARKKRKLDRADEAKHRKKAKGKTEKPSLARKTKQIPLTEANPDHMGAIIAGTTLPSSKKEANAAARARYSRLQAQQSSAVNSNFKRVIKPRKEPDILPEFFNKKNFPAGPSRDNQVRCVCGVVRDDGGAMISCDKCNVWQHKACMGEAVPKDPDNEDYLCHVCDPWAHRVLIAKLRRDQPLNG